MKKLFDMMKVDLITMNGGKNSTKITAIVFVIFIGGTGFLFSPIAGVYCPFILGTFFVPVLFHNELKYHSGRMWSLLPVKRRDLVNSRFLLVMGLYVISSVVFYVLMLISLKLKPYYLFFGNDSENMDIIKLIVVHIGGAFTELGFFNLIYFTAFAIGLTVAANGLRRYFRDPESFSGKIIIGASKRKTKEMKRYDVIGGAVALIAIIAVILFITGIIEIGPAVLVVLQVILQLAEAANGFLLGAVMIISSVISAAYQYICTVLEHEDKEL